MDAPTRPNQFDHSVEEAFMEIFRHEHLVEIQKAAVEVGLSKHRAALLVGVPAPIVASLPYEFSPGAQLLADLGALNSISILTDGTMPLAAWLTNAVVLVGARRDAAVLQEALDVCRGACPQGIHPSDVQHARKSDAPLAPSDPSVSARPS
ncbi:MAG: hypothetical protein R3B70_39730, partial [Polyangiaceae bacterium]